MANKSPWQRAFIQGYACAVANIIRTHGEDGIAWDVFVANKCEPKECDAGDREVLQKAGFFNRRARKETPAESADACMAKVRQHFDERRCTCKDYPGADEFCTAHKAGTRLERTAVNGFCSTCGFPIADHARPEAACPTRYCPHCGKSEPHEHQGKPYPSPPNR